jgi:hypothetical protein
VQRHAERRLEDARNIATNAIAIVRYRIDIDVNPASRAAAE